MRLIATKRGNSPENADNLTIALHTGFSVVFRPLYEWNALLTLYSMQHGKKQLAVLRNPLPAIS